MIRALTRALRRVRNNRELPLAERNVLATRTIHSKAQQSRVWWCVVCGAVQCSKAQ